MKAGSFLIESLELSDMKVHVYGDAAVATGLSIVNKHSKSGYVRFGSRFTDTYVRRNGCWQCVAWQSLGVPLQDEGLESRPKESLKLELKSDEALESRPKESTKVELKSDEAQKPRPKESTKVELKSAVTPTSSGSAEQPPLTRDLTLPGSAELPLLPNSHTRSPADAREYITETEATQHLAEFPLTSANLCGKFPLDGQRTHDIATSLQSGCIMTRNPEGGGMTTKTEKQYEHLEPRPGSNYRQLFLKGRRTERQWSTRSFTVPIPDVLKNLRRSIRSRWRRCWRLSTTWPQNRPLIEQERDHEAARLRARGLLGPAPV